MKKKHTTKTNMSSNKPSKILFQNSSKTNPKTSARKPSKKTNPSKNANKHPCKISETHRKPSKHFPNNPLNIL